MMENNMTTVEVQEPNDVISVVSLQIQVMPDGSTRENLMFDIDFLQQLGVDTEQFLATIDVELMTTFAQYVFDHIREHIEEVVVEGQE